MIRAYIDTNILVDLVLSRQEFTPAEFIDKTDSKDFA